MTTTESAPFRLDSFYRIRIEGELPACWSDWFGGMEIAVAGDETLIAGRVPDQPALHGILRKIRDLGLTLVALERLPTRTNDR